MIRKQLCSNKVSTFTSICQEKKLWLLATQTDKLNEPILNYFILVLSTKDLHFKVTSEIPLHLVPFCRGLLILFQVRRLASEGYWSKSLHQVPLQPYWARAIRWEHPHPTEVDGFWYRSKLFSFFRVLLWLPCIFLEPLSRTFHARF